MTHAYHRNLIAPAAIGVSIIVGMKLYLVHPLKERLEQTRLQAQVISDTAARLSHSDIAFDQLQDRQTVADHRLEKIMLAGQIVRDEGMLFQNISDISTAANVSLERLDPQPNANRASDATGVTSLRCSIEASGSYGSIAVFIRNLELKLGITIVRSVHIAPAHVGEDEIVFASIETEHFSINPRAGMIEGRGQ